MALSKRALDGNVETMLLSLLQQGPNYGYGLVQALNERAPELVAFGEGTVYPVLHRMERKGLLSTSWGEEGGRRRKYYRLSQKGRRALQANLEEWRDLVAAMALMTGKVPRLI
jgi:PadR family transcriptional regulator, regulatory protein PadR